MKNNQKINLPAVVEDDVSFFHQAAMAMRQGLATAAMRVEDRAAALRQQVASTKSAIAARPIVSDYSRKINSGGSFPVRVNGQWVDVASADFLGWLFQAGHIEEYSDAGEIRNMGYVYTEQEFLEWLHQLEGLLASYFQATGSAPEWADYLTANDDQI